ncbi:MAG: hypothetical protein Q9216_001739 [Gyalolechia sp. 2 TL-2023]
MDSCRQKTRRTEDELESAAEQAAAARRQQFYKEGQKDSMDVRGLCEDVTNVVPAKSTKSRSSPTKIPPAGTDTSSRYRFRASIIARGMTESSIEEASGHQRRHVVDEGAGSRGSLPRSDATNPPSTGSTVPPEPNATPSAATAPGSPSEARPEQSSNSADTSSTVMETHSSASGSEKERPLRVSAAQAVDIPIRSWKDIWDSSAFPGLFVWQRTSEDTMTVADRSSRLSNVVQPDWAPAFDFANQMDAISRLLSVHLSTCSDYQKRLPGIRDGLAINGSEKDSLEDTQTRLCWFLGNISHDLPHYYIHVARFSESLIHQSNITHEQIQTTLSNRSSQELIAEQNTINQKIPQIIAIWQRNYKMLETPGQYILHDLLDPARGDVSALQAALMRARRQTVLAARREIMSWNLPRRVGRWLGWLRMDVEELEPYNEAIEVVDEWLVATRALRSLIVVITSNVTEVSRELSNIASNKFSADVRFELGAGGLFELNSYIIELGQQARGIQKTLIGGRRQKATEDLEVETDTVDVSREGEGH